MMQRIITGRLKTLAIVLGLVGSLASSLRAANYSERMYAYDILFPGDYLVSQDGVWKLWMYVYLNSPPGTGHLSRRHPCCAPIWVPTGADGTHAQMQTDGNFVYYNNTTALWSTDTDGFPGAYLQMQNDSNLVVYTPSNTPIWSIW